MKFCKDCEHCAYGLYTQVCSRPTGDLDPVDGAPVRRHDHCRPERSPRGSCGPDAKHFKQRNMHIFKLPQRFFTQRNARDD